jgi:hypothetical protein
MPRWATILCLAVWSCAFSQSRSASILVIGDSNTEHGFITLALADTLHRYFGIDAMGTGYIPFDSSFYAIRYNRYTGVAIGYSTASWSTMDIYEGTRLATRPYLSPNGQWLKSTSVNAAATVTFSGNGIDVYWLSQNLGGSFSIAIDNSIRDTIATTGATAVQKTSLMGLAEGRHTIIFKVTSVPAQGNVTLLGFDARNDIDGLVKRSVVHNWGNGYCTTADFLKIDSTVFVSGLQQLAPDIVVVLLGTNDYYIDQRSAAEFKTNLKNIVARIKAAGFTSKILLVSTFMTTDTYGPDFLPLYQATAWPQAASETDSRYWDMCAWFGPYKAANMNGTVHCNAAGGRLIANELLQHILPMLPMTEISESQTQRPAIRDYSFRCISDKIVLTNMRNTPYRIDLISTTGRRTACLQGTGSHRYRFDEGTLHLQPGTYIATLNLDGHVDRFLFAVVK